MKHCASWDPSACTTCEVELIWRIIGPELMWLSAVDGCRMMFDQKNKYLFGTNNLNYYTWIKFAYGSYDKNLLKEKGLQTRNIISSSACLCHLVVLWGRELPLELYFWRVSICTNYSYFINIIVQLDCFSGAVIAQVRQCIKHWSMCGTVLSQLLVKSNQWFA